MKEVEEEVSAVWVGGRLADIVKQEEGRKGPS
jgi:hypothetical protein